MAVVIIGPEIVENSITNRELLQASFSLRSPVDVQGTAGSRASIQTGSDVLGTDYEASSGVEREHLCQVRPNHGGRRRCKTG